MITLKEALAVHAIALKKFGGVEGIRDIGMLESALQRPFLTFDGRELYPSILEKSAALIESIVKNHPFSDGNKRTGYILMRLMLLKMDVDVWASEDEKYKFVVDIASGQLDYNGIKLWLEKKVK